MYSVNKRNLFGEYIMKYDVIVVGAGSAGSIVAALPPVILFFLLQKHFITVLTLGAVKE